MIIREILQQNNEGLGNYKTPDCVGYDHYDATGQIIFEENNFNSYFPLAKGIFDNFGNSTKILELGCGAGVLSYHYRNLNPNVTYVTLDINKDVKGNKIVKDDWHFICYTDRNFQLLENDTPMKFDLILSFEHFEHIPTENIKVFLANIKRHSNENTIIIATAALWSGDDGRHPLVLNFEQWKKLLNDNGFEMIENKYFLREYGVPYNFSINASLELIFRLK